MMMVMIHKDASSKLLFLAAKETYNNIIPLLMISLFQTKCSFMHFCLHEINDFSFVLRFVVTFLLFLICSFFFLLFLVITSIE